MGAGSSDARGRFLSRLGTSSAAERRNWIASSAEKTGTRAARRFHGFMTARAPVNPRARTLAQPRSGVFCSNSIRTLNYRAARPCDKTVARKTGESLSSRLISIHLSYQSERKNTSVVFSRIYSSVSPGQVSLLNIPFSRVVKG